MAKATTALGRLLAEWDAAHGTVDEDVATWAAAQFDQLDGVAERPAERTRPVRP